jgi:hypothetical protein
MDLSIRKFPDDLFRCKTIPLHPDHPFLAQALLYTNLEPGPVFGGQAKSIRVFQAGSWTLADRCEPGVY